MIQLIQLQLAFGDLPLLDGASLSVQRGDKLGLIGRNGSGKSSLLKLIAVTIQADDGLIQREDGVDAKPSWHAWHLAPNFQAAGNELDESSPLQWRHRDHVWGVSAF